MTNILFVDSVAIWAFFDAGDQHHRAASDCFEKLFEEDARFLLTEHIFSEVVTGLRMRAGHRPAVKAGETLREDKRFFIADVERATRDRAWEIFRRYDKLRLSFTDCLSCAVMKERRIERIFTFDNDFAILGCEVVPNLP